MAVITNIRKRAGLLVFVIGFAMVAFVAMDALNSQSSILGGSRNTVGEIKGVNISIQDFEKLVEKEKEAYKANNNQMTLDVATVQKIREDTWNKLVRETIMQDEYEELGLAVTTDELLDMVQGSNPHPAVKQSFTNPETGIFDPSQVLLFLKGLDNDQTGESRKRWMNFEDFLIESRLIAKYTTAIKNGFFVSPWQAKADFFQKNRKANIKYIFFNYTSIADTAVNVTEDDIKDYIKRHKNKYEQKDESRKLEYVVFNIVPSEEDTAEVLEWLNSHVALFKNAENDSLYTILNSETPFDNAYYSLDKLATSIKDTLFEIDTSTVIGPYFEDGSYKLAKLLDRKLIPDSVKVRHILLKITTPQEYQDADKKIDSLKEAIEGGASFKTLALQFSQDPESSNKGGDLGWVQPETMVKPFNDAVFFNGKKGDLLKVFSQFGFHLIEVLASTPSTTAVKVAYLTQEVEASTETIRNIYAEANEFAGKNRTPDNFQKTLIEEGYTKRIADAIKINDYVIIGLGSARDIVRWAYKAYEEDISDVLELEDKFIVAHMADIREEGSVSLDDIRTEIEIKVNKEKKAEIIIDKISKINQGDLSIDKLAATMGQELKTADNITFASPFIPGIGRETNVLGTIFGMKKGKMSKPIRGDNGVVIIQVDSFSYLAAEENYTMYQKQLENAVRSRTDYAAMEALKEKADIVDNRHLFY